MVGSGAAALRTQSAPGEMVQLSEITDSLNKLLRTAEVPDYPQAHNGLQFENSGNIQGVAAAVDFSLRAIKLARADGAACRPFRYGFSGSDNRSCRRRLVLLDAPPRHGGGLTPPTHA